MEMHSGTNLLKIKNKIKLKKKKKKIRGKAIY